MFDIVSVTCGFISDFQALDPGILGDVPVAPQLVRQPGPVPGADQRARTGASLLSPRDQMDVSVKLSQLSGN